MHEPVHCIKLARMHWQEAGASNVSDITRRIAKMHSGKLAHCDRDLFRFVKMPVATRYTNL